MVGLDDTGHVGDRVVDIDQPVPTDTLGSWPLSIKHGRYELSGVNVTAYDWFKMFQRFEFEKNS